LPEAARKDLGIVIKSGEHLYTLINQVLDLSKIEAVRATLDQRDFDLYELLDELAETFTLAARQKGLQLRIDNAADVPKYIKADAVKLRQVLINLLNNAIKFTSEGSVILKVGKGSGLPSPQEGPNGCRLSFAVIDTGPGIAPDELRELGNAFMQTQAGRRAREGTGLGLAISRSFVQLMGGELKATSEIARGTTFAFDIPVQRVEATSVTPSIERGRRVIGLAPNQPRYRILAVDDRMEGRQLLTRMLTPLGFEVREAGNGEEAIAIWEAWEPHLIWMDMRMPVMDGREATRRIKSTAKGKETKIIALTASSFEEERQEILRIGCNDFLRKPFREAVLFQLMRQHLGVQFVYENEPLLPSTTQPEAASMAALPAELQARLKQTVSQLDVNGIQAVIADIQVHDPVLAEGLTKLATNFQYRQILALFQEGA
jgi:CheY-like chemotaxis protein